MSAPYAVRTAPRLYGPKSALLVIPVVDPSVSASAFAEQVLRRPLWSHQVAAVESDRFIVAIAGGRRSGKTLAAQVKAIFVAATNRDARVLVVSPAIETSRNWMRDLADVLAVSKLKGSVVDEQAQVITLSNNSEIRCVAATAAQIRGRGRGLRLVIVDEAAFVDSTVWRALFYTLFDLRAEGSQALLVCSPWGRPEHFFRQAFDRGIDGDPDYVAFQWSMRDNPTISPAFIERERERIAPSEAAAEIDGVWSDAAGALFSRELLEAATADVELPALADLRGPARGLIGCDWGASFDRSAAVAVYRSPVAGLNPDRDATPCFVALPYVWPVKTPLHRVVGDIATVGGRFSHIASETNGIGSMPTQELFRTVRTRNPRMRFVWAATATTAGSKTAGYSTILGLLERGQLVLPRHPDLLRQLAGLRFEHGERGFVRIGAEDAAVHDDIADALMLAALPYRPARAKRTVCHLATLAARSKAAPDAQVPELDCPVITTGSGLRVYQRPPLQGPSRPDVSLYATAVPPKPIGITAGRFRFETTRRSTHE